MIKIASKKSVNYDTGNKVTLRKKCPCLEFLWFVFSRIRNEYGPEKLRIRTFFTQWPFFKGTAKIKRWSFQGRNFISLETVGGMFTLVIIEAWRHVFVSYRETLNLLLKKSITTTDEPPTLLTLLTFIIIVIKVAQSILIMTTEMLIAILLQKRIE